MGRTRVVHAFMHGHSSSACGNVGGTTDAPSEESNWGGREEETGGQLDSYRAAAEERHRSGGMDNDGQQGTC